MMIRHLMQCEMCPASFDFNPQEHPAHRDIPQPWLVLFTHGPMQTQEGRHFCSASCLQKWLSDTCGPTIAEKIKAWEAAHPDVDCAGKLIHPYYADTLISSLNCVFTPPPPTGKR